jgi:hypothetical protein
MDVYIAPDPRSAGEWVLDDFFHFLGGSDDDHRALEAAIERRRAAG